MYRIYQQRNALGRLINRYTVECYIFDKESHSNVKWASFENISAEDVARYLQSTDGVQQEDNDFSFVILKSGNGPVIFTDNGTLMPVSVKS